VKHIIDSSVILRRVLGDAKMLAVGIEDACASRLARIEVARALQRLRLEGQVDDAELARLVGEAELELATVDILELTSSILDRAAGPMPTVVKTLDAMHLATALVVRDSGQAVTFVTHDAQQGRAAKALGFAVLGLD